MRAFLAIEIEESLKNKIKKTQQTIKNTNSAKIKYVEDENIHLTLKFFGEINQRKQKQISSIIRKTTENYETYTMKLVKVGAFPNMNRPRVIWTGIKDNDTTINLIKELDDEFNKIGFKKEHDYTPHITIGRVRDVYNKNNLSNILKQLSKTYYGKMNIKKIHLKSSTLTPTGPIYAASPPKRSV